ncbi:cutinase family protein [Lolliginicoccus suaedae]|uniref:cutinase family protein n=1 Tax=Lolliginicoccus suaedae TaxID=2605429 RepID=UPI0011F014FD|nr:cutinase family protein [Lolliginicoccus suaedae]
MLPITDWRGPRTEATPPRGRIRRCATRTAVLAIGAMMAASPSAAAQVSDDEPEPTAPGQQLDAMIGESCADTYVLGVRGSNEPPKGAAATTAPGSVVYPEGTEGLGMGPTVHAFFESFGTYRARSGESVPAGFGIDYPAVRVGEGLLLYPMVYRDSVDAGAANLRGALEQISAACGDSGTEVVVAGVSQGADVINTALATEQGQGTDAFGLVTRIVLFGDPSRSAAQSTITAGAERGEGIFRMVPLSGFGQDGWMASNPRVISVCIPGDSVCDPASDPADAGNVTGADGMSPFDRHQAYIDPGVQLRCPGTSDDGAFLDGTSCAASLVAMPTSR